MTSRAPRATLGSSSRQRMRTSLALQLREYRSRLLPLTLVALLPIGFWAGTFFSLPPDSEPVGAFYLEQFEARIGPLQVTEIPERDTWPFDTSLMGVGWALSVAALFSVIGSGSRDRRLVLAGYRPQEILVARFAILALIALPISMIPVALVVLFADVQPGYPVLVWLGSFLAALVAIGLGLIVGSLLPRQLEGTILLIGVIGVEVSIPLNVAVRDYLPFFGPQMLYTAGRYAAEPAVLVPALVALAWAAGLVVIAVLLWSRRVRIQRWPAAQPTTIAHAVEAAVSESSFGGGS